MDNAAIETGGTYFEKNTIRLLWMSVNVQRSLTLSLILRMKPPGYNGIVNDIMVALNESTEVRN